VRKEVSLEVHNLAIIYVYRSRYPDRVSNFHNEYSEKKKYNPGAF
jgi:hypothetical protein